MRLNLKFWKWKIFHREKEEEKKTDDRTEKYEILSTKDIVMTTTESELELKGCKVRSDHFLMYRDNKVDGAKKRKPRVLNTPKVLILPVWEILGVSGENVILKILKRVLVRWAMPKYLRFRTYTVRREGEVTHDPHEDHYKLDEKMSLEETLKLEGKFAEANAGAEIYEGMKGKPKWYDYIPYLVIAVIVFFFLFAFQIQPNL